MEQAMVYPVAALVLLTAIMTLRSARMNLAAVRSRSVRSDQFLVFESGDLPMPVQLAARNVANLFEYPTAFYALAAFLCIFERVNLFFLTGAWLYVALRCAHSYVHVKGDNLLHRLRTFAASCFVLWAMWAVFVGMLLWPT